MQAHELAWMVQRSVAVFFFVFIGWLLFALCTMLGSCEVAKLGKTLIPGSCKF